jgi:hypothetical protein
MDKPNAASQTPLEKGNALEQAVRTLETVILRSFPGYSESAFRIEGKKLLRIGGVQHEIDIYITVDLGPGYKSVFIFECKNWEDKGGKNEIIVFSAKIDVTNAQRGFFVAKSYTADAVAQAELDPRIELLSAVELDPSALVIPGAYHAIFIGETNAAVCIRMEGASPNAIPVPIDVATASFVLNGAAGVLNDYVMSWVDTAKQARCDHFPSAHLDAGSYILEFSDERHFDAGQAVVNNMPVSIMTVKGTVKVQVRKPVIVSAFEVESRGRIITVQTADESVQVTAYFVELANTSGTRVVPS